MFTTLFGHLGYLAEKLLRHPQHALEIVLLAVFIYYAIMFVRGTRMLAVLRGAMWLAGIFFIANILSFDTINMLYRSLAQFVVFSFIVMFAPEMRRALMTLGRQSIIRRVLGKKPLSDPIREAVRLLANQQIGALLAVERKVGLRSYANTGVPLDAEVSAPTLVSIFFPRNPLHDGGVIIENVRILAAACIFPLSNNPLSRLMGTRHRAAMGMSEESDALVVCISEETGKISIFENGVWDEGISVAEVGERLARATL